VKVVLLICLCLLFYCLCIAKYNLFKLIIEKANSHTSSLYKFKLEHERKIARNIKFAFDQELISEYNSYKFRNFSDENKSFEDEESYQL
jgi:hypothetical protein